MLLIVNPEARHGRTRALVPAIKRLLKAVPHDLQLTTRPGEAAHIARTARGFDVIVAVGGDGTVHEVLNGLMSHPPGERPALGIIPTGSGNDTCRTLGIPVDLTDAVLTLTSGRCRRLDVGICNDAYFSNSFSAGLDARVTAKAVEYKTTTRRTGLWLYFSALIHVLLHELESYHLRVMLDAERCDEMDALLVAATIGPTYGGGFRNTPDADPDDGLLEICVIDQLTLPQALVRLPFVILGKHTRMRVVHMARQQRLKIESDVPMPAQIDGEVLVGQRFDIGVAARAVEYIVPKEI